jgi:hypothetical protein
MTKTKQQTAMSWTYRRVSHGLLRPNSRTKVYGLRPETTDYGLPKLKQGSNSTGVRTGPLVADDVNKREFLDEPWKYL